MSSRWATAVTSRSGALLILLTTAALTALVWLTSPAQPADEPTDGLPAGKQSTRVVELADRFPSGRTDAAVVVYERANGPLTAADREAIASTAKALAATAEGGFVPAAQISPDERAALLIVPVAGGLDDTAQSAVVDAIRATVSASPGSPAPPGLTAQVTGGPAFSRDIAAAFDGADLTLLLTTAGVVALLLLATYRSPVLWIAPLLVIGVGDQLVAKLLPWVGRLVGERTDAAVSGIVSVLVFGAGTDYALLLISRYREQLRRTPDRRHAMAIALRAATPAVVGSAATVILALLTLILATLTSNRTLGVSAAIGVAIALLFGLVVLPAVLACLPRGVFWPLVPRVGSAEPSDTGLWARIAGAVGRRPAVVLTVAVVLLGALSTGLLSTRIGLSQTEQFRTEVESVTAQQALARHFPAGSSQPLAVISTSAQAGAVTAALRTVDGVADVGRPETSDDGSLSQVSVQLTDGSGTAAADRSVRDIRDALAGIPGADGLVGGAPAVDLDQRDANVRDNLIIGALVLAVVLLVLIMLLRSLVAPVLLLLTVVVSYAASLGAATLVLTHLLDLPALDAGVPLLSFLFLVALGVDYNIFLVTRAREESIVRGDTGTATIRALGTTGAVITSAGVLLAAVFAVLGVLPVIALTQIGVIVGIGVLLDTLLVRTLVVPAIILLLGERFWWPGRPGHRPPAGPRAEVAVTSEALPR
ncbi:RND superfamily putative drug exporter [Actinoplanes octamycinicus]|uniref:RND superfamily putative drug exporter n=1 Tax=Actinoplanes octamycinicus TaxID=135948 RepID=A0A7W7H168_9ACTN|nr:MMPL family transporter [Actinoplanes octamycinicus]MBB4742086.1 RND superfamily putative drug exporter [Actinoplanes octamycinicus]GIE63678.1 membrane protein [Actinoplanes octamycinicus]